MLIQIKGNHTISNDFKCRRFLSKQKRKHNKLSIDIEIERSNCKLFPYLLHTKVFITGGTGFVGIALVEKLLRSTDVGKVKVMN